MADNKNSGPARSRRYYGRKIPRIFTSNPFIHLDIAGTSYTEKYEDYRGI
jgi:leucyl aminopeptidase